MMRITFLAFLFCPFSQAVAQSVPDYTYWRGGSVIELVDEAEAQELLLEAPISLVGETHGREAHQDWQADLLLNLALEGRYPSVVMEHLRPSMMEPLMEFRSESPERTAGLALALDWWDTGWPAWSFYEPIFKRIWQLKLDVRAGDLDLETMEELALQLQATQSNPDLLIELEPWDRSRTLAEVLTPEYIAQSWQETIEQSHCGLLEAERAPLLTARQIIRDENMARAVFEAAVEEAEHGVVLFAGSAHTRESRGIEQQLIAMGLEPGQILSVGLIEHDPTTPWPPTDEAMRDFDLIVRTPHSGKKRACERLRDLGLAPPLEEDG